MANNDLRLTEKSTTNSNEDIFDDMEENIIQSTIMEEQDVLSQKLSQLSTTRVQSQTKQRKRSDDANISSPINDSLIPNDDDVYDYDNDDENKLPTYLSLTNQSFTQMIERILNTSFKSMTIEELRELAILIYQSAIIDLEKSIWLTYFKAGTGTLKSEQSSPEIWPTMLKSYVISLKKNNLNNDHLDDLCLKLVNIRLHRFDHKQQQYQDKLHDKIEFISDYRTRILSILQTYIKENLQPLQVQYDYHIQLIIYDYEYHRLELEFLAQDPTEYQLEIFQCLSRRKYKQEKAKQEVIFLKEQLKQHKLPDSFNSIQPLSLPSLIQTIDDSDSRHYLSARYQKRH